jgi:hypothetical protein
VHTRLLADHGPAEFHGCVPRLEVVGGVWHPNPDRVLITLIRAFAHLRAPKPPTSVQYQRRASAESVKRRGVDRAAPPRPRRNPVWVPARQSGWLWSPSAPGQRMLPWNHPSPAVVAAHRFDHWPITDRSRGQRLVHASITRHWAAPQPPGVNDGMSSGHTAALACLRRLAAPIPRHSDGPACDTPSAHPVRQPREPRAPGQQHPQPALAAAPLRPPLARHPCGHRRTLRSGSQPQPGQLPHQPPAANPKLGPHPLHRPPLRDMALL